MKLLYISFTLFILFHCFANFNECKSEINLVIQGLGKINILNEYFYLDPSEVIVNCDLKPECNKNCYLDNELNNVTIKFDKQLETLENMFKDLDKIIEIDLSNLDTSKVKNMASMFEQCSNLEKISFGNINTSSVENMRRLFFNCSKLISVDLSNFETSSVTDMREIFSICSSLTSIDITNFNTSKIEDMFDMFGNNFKLISVNVSSFDTSKVTSFQGMFYECRDLKYLDLSNFNTSSMTTIKFMFYGCNSLVYLNLKNFKIIETANLNNIFSGGIANAKICANEVNTINVLKSYGNEVNCSDKCFVENIKIDLKNKICIENCNESEYKYEYNHFCYEAYPNYTFISNNIKWLCPNNARSLNLSTIRIFIKNNLNLDKLNNDDIIFNDNEGSIKYTITTSFNQQNSDKNKNNTTINLGKCESKLKDNYNISENDTLYILKIDINLEGLKIPKIEYEVYYPLYNKTLSTLNLSICKDTKINLSIPIDISLNEIDKHNASSGFYNDLCYTSRTKNGTDIILKDRQKEFVNYNKTVCEENCKFIFYDNELKKATCSCSIKDEIPVLSEIKMNTKLLISNFMDINNFGNFKLIKCFHLLLDKKTIFKNTSNYLIIIIMIISIISIFVFSFTDYSKIKKTIYTKKPEKNNKITKNNRKRSKTKSLNKKNDNIGTGIHLMNTILNQNKNKKGMINLNKKDQKKSKLKKKTGNLSNNNIINNFNNSNNNKIKKRRHKSLYVMNTLNKSDKNGKDEEKRIFYTDYEMNILEYNEALKTDKRTYIQYYLSLLKTNHLLFFTFFNNNDYNSKIIKVYIFFLNMVMSYTLNAMFYSETIMHRIYVESGKFNFLNQIPEMVYSSLIGAFLNTIIKTLGLYQNIIIKIKKSKKEDIENKKEAELKKIKFKAFLFFIISYIFIIFFWIYLGCFCAVYKNTQVHLLKEVISSIAISFVLPFFIYLIPGIFRKSALKKENISLYKFSQLLQII